MFRRLRLAIEIDCDARVLAQAGDVRTYGDLLIDVGERTLTGAAPIAALSESSAQLERRIDAMSRRKAQRASLRALGAIGASVVLGIAAWKLPALAADAQQRPATMGVDSSRGTARPERVIVSVNSISVRDPGPLPTFLVWSVGGPVRFATGTDSLRPLIGTVRLNRVTGLRFDVTDGHAFIGLEGQGTLMLGAEIKGAAARYAASGPVIIFRRGGSGIESRDDITAQFGVAQAQGSALAFGGDTARRVPGPLDGMRLTAAQRVAINRIQQRYQRHISKVNYDPSIAAEARPWMVLALRDKQRAEMRTVLTAEQRVVFDRRAAATKAAGEEIVRQGLADQRQRSRQP
jgi:hypothetical protein